LEVTILPFLASGGSSLGIIGRTSMAKQVGKLSTAPQIMTAVIVLTTQIAAGITLWMSALSDEVAAASFNSSNLGNRSI